MSLSELRVFGRSGTPISPLTLGTMNFGEGPGGAPGAPTGAEESIRIIQSALDAGITAVDTANVYSQRESEQVVGRALRGRRDDVFLATKFHGQMSPNPAHAGNSRRWITQAVEGSLRRLELSLVDLAVGFALAHPAISSVIIGPRSEEHLAAYLRAAEVRLGESVLDVIDDVVPPGTNFVERDAGAIVPSLEFAELRRR